LDQKIASFELDLHKLIFGQLASALEYEVLKEGLGPDRAVHGTLSLLSPQEGQRMTPIKNKLSVGGIRTLDICDIKQIRNDIAHPVGLNGVNLTAPALRELIDRTTALSAKQKGTVMLFLAELVRRRAGTSDALLFRPQ